MSQQNVEIARSFYVAFNAGDMEAVREMLDPDVAVGRELEGGPETGPFVGRDAVMRGWEQAREPRRPPPSRLKQAAPRLVRSQRGNSSSPGQRLG